MDFRAVVFLVLWTFLSGPVLGGGAGFSWPWDTNSQVAAKVTPAEPAPPPAPETPIY